MLLKITPYQLIELNDKILTFQVNQTTKTVLIALSYYLILESSN